MAGATPSRDDTAPRFTGGPGPSALQSRPRAAAPAPMPERMPPIRPARPHDQPEPMTVRPPFRLARLFAAFAFAAATLAGCASIDNTPVNQPSALPRITAANTVGGDDTLRTTIVGLAFSGGGTRAAAFSFGVLKGLRRIDLIDQVRFVSGVSGGSVTAAYFGLRGRAALDDFESRFLYRDAEEALRTQVYSVGNVMRALDGGVNDRSGLPTWLQQNLFGAATFKDFRRPGRPVVWINASDIYSKTPFIFEPLTFASICSDLDRYPIAEAVAASAAVPIVFTPVVIRNYADKCGFTLPDYLESEAKNRDASPNVRAYINALTQYRNTSKIGFVKLLDGGLTDNWGLAGINVALGAAPEPFKPLTREDAITVEKFLFVVVDAGRTISGDWTKTLEGPNAKELLDAVTDTAVDSAVRNSFEVLRLQMKLWETRLRSWRCSLTPDEVARIRGTADGWNCNAVNIRVERVAFEDLDPDTAQRLGRIPTRFKLEPAEVKLAVDAGEQVVAKVLGGH